MLEIFGLTVERLRMYAADGLHLWLFLAALLCIVCWKRETENKKLFVGYTAVFAAIYFCPVTAKIIMDYCVGRDVYWRMFWLLPIPMVLSYVGVKLFCAQNTKVKRAAVLLAAALLLSVTGRFVYQPGEVLFQTENLQKLPSAAAAVCGIINQNREEGETVKAVMPDELVGYVRQYDAGIGLAYGRRGSMSKKDRAIHDQMVSQKPNFHRLVKKTRKTRSNYLVYLETKKSKVKIERWKYKEIGRTNGYIIYKDTMPLPPRTDVPQ